VGPQKLTPTRLPLSDLPRASSPTENSLFYWGNCLASWTPREMDDSLGKQQTNPKTHKEKLENMMARKRFANLTFLGWESRKPRYIILNLHALRRDVIKC
jgi:hypothetical protein